MTKQEAIDRCRAEMKVGGHPIRTTIELTRQLRIDGEAMPLHVTNETLLNVEERLIRVERLLATRDKPRRAKPKAAA